MIASETDDAIQDSEYTQSHVLIWLFTRASRDGSLAEIIQARKNLPKICFASADEILDDMCLSGNSKYFGVWVVLQLQVTT